MPREIRPRPLDLPKPQTDLQDPSAPLQRAQEAPAGGPQRLDPRHIIGAPCPSGHTLRYRNGGGCVICARAHVAASVARRRERERSRDAQAGQMPGI